LGGQQNPNRSGILYNLHLLIRLISTYSNFKIRIYHVSDIKFDSWSLNVPIFEWKRAVKRNTFLVLNQGLCSHKRIVWLRKTIFEIDNLMEKSSQYPLQYFSFSVSLKKEYKARK